jgi:diacylglycerol kinase (ATP)
MTPEPMHIEVDGKLWYEGRIYVVAVANGTTFGQGMMIAPKARYDDGLLDVILIDDATRTELLLALRTVFNGSHLEQSTCALHTWQRNHDYKRWTCYWARFGW